MHVVAFERRAEEARVARSTRPVEAVACKLIHFNVPTY